MDYANFRTRGERDSSRIGVYTTPCWLETMQSSSFAAYLGTSRKHCMKATRKYDRVSSWLRSVALGYDNMQGMSLLRLRGDFWPDQLSLALRLSEPRRLHLVVSRTRPVAAPQFLKVITIYGINYS
jgi:hypothetical protein